MEHHEPEHEPVAPAPAPAAAELPSPEVAPAFGGPVSAAGGAWLNGAAQLGPTGRAATVARLQRAAGNRAVSRAILARVEDMDLGAKEDYRVAEEIKRLGITIDPEKATDEEKLAEIRRLGPGAGASRVWGWFGGRLETTAFANRELFEACLKADPDLIKLPDFGQIRAKFRAAVEGKVIGNLQTNRQFVADEMTKLGITADGAPPTAEQDAHLRETQLLAEQVQKAQEGMAKAFGIKVGYAWEEVPGPGNSSKFEKSPHYFDLVWKPHMPGDGPDFADYDQVKKHYDTLNFGVKSILANSPGVYAIVGDEIGGRKPGDAAGRFAGAEGGDARAQIKPALEALAGRIDAAVPLVGTDLDYRDFLPVHDQLMKSPEWSGGIEKAFIAEEVHGRELGKLLRSLGLAAVSAAGFILANLATGGLATFLLVAGAVGASGLQAKLSIDDYVAKSTAAQAKTGDPSLDIISKEQVDSALFQAVLDTALAFIDAASGVGAVVKKLTPGFKLVQAAEAGTKATATITLKEALVSGDAAAKVTAIEKSVAEVGVQGTLQASGRSAEDLAQLAGPGSDTARKLLAGKDVAGKGLEDLAAKLADLGKVPAGEVEAVARTAVTQFGYQGALQRAGGWKSFTKALGEGSPVVKELEAWRSGLVQEGIDFLKASSKGESTAVRTGTPKGTSDVDISTFGRDAAQNVERVKEYLAKRVGVGRDKLEFMLDADAAVNPARMHLQDVAKGLSAETYSAIEREAARHQESLVYNRRFYDATAAADKDLAEKLAKEAADRGIAIDKAWKPLTPSEVAALERRMDGWAQELAAMEQRGATEAEKRRLIEQMGRAQSEVLSTNPNMYATGGSIRQNVSTRAGDKEKIEGALGTKLDKPAFPASRYTAILGEGPFLDKAIASIRTSEDVKDIVKALKDFGKHGERVTQALGRDVAVGGISSSAMDTLAADLFSWVERAKTPELAREVAARGIPAVRAQVEGQLARLSGSMEQGIKVLREQAALGAALTAEESAGMAAWVRAQAAAQARRDAVMAAIGRLEEQLAGGQALGRGLQPALRFPFDQPPADDDAEICEPLPEPRQSTLR